MSKIAEQKALEAYPEVKYKTLGMLEGGGLIEVDLNIQKRDGYIKGYYQAMKDFSNKSCKWLSEHLFTKIVEDSPSQHYVRSVESMGNFITQTEFIEQFKNYIENESEN